MKKKDCCKEKVVSYKLKSSQNSSTKYTWAKGFKLEKEFTSILTIPAFAAAITPTVFSISDDPPERTAQLYLVNRVFRI